jgi:hypothetical protein
MPAAQRDGLLAGVLSVVGFLAYLVAARSLPLGPVHRPARDQRDLRRADRHPAAEGGFGLRRIAASTMVVAGIGLLAFWR